MNATYRMLFDADAGMVAATCAADSDNRQKLTARGLRNPFLREFLRFGMG
jgi:hypothetical protein